MLGDVVNAYVDGATAEGYAEDWDLEKLWTALNTLYPITLDREKLVDEAEDLTRDAVTAAVLADARAAYAAREAEIDAVIGAQGGMRELERQVLLQVMDRKWREHLYEMDYLKEGIGLRAMAQRDPLIEYQREGYDMFAAMLEGIKEETVTHLFHVRVQAVPPPAPEPQPAAEAEPRPAPTAAPAAPAVPPPPPQPRKRPRPAAAATAPTGRHAAPEGDPSAPTGALPTVLAGGRPRPPSELQYSGPAEDGSTARSRSSGSPRGAAARGGASSGEPARNRPCPCGSGRKYKHCHGAPTAARP
jgi:preprotein translocase subunit SecA